MVIFSLPSFLGQGMINRPWVSFPMEIRSVVTAIVSLASVHLFTILQGKGTTANVGLRYSCDFEVLKLARCEAK